MKHPRQTLPAVLILVLTALPAVGDTKITMEEGTGLADDGAELPEETREAYADQEPTTAVYWIGKDRAARIGDSGSMISRLDRREAYFVNHQTKSYSVIVLGGGNDPESPSSSSSEIVRSAETRQFGEWNTTRYDLNLEVGTEAVEIALWVSDEVGVDLSAYQAYVKGMAAQPGLEWMLRFLEVDGYPVRQEVRIGPILSWQQLVSVSDETAPDGTYEPPTGYTKSN